MPTPDDIQKLPPVQRLTITKLTDALILVRQQKPGDRSELDRHCAIIITETEKLIALYWGLIISNGEFINE